MRNSISWSTIGNITGTLIVVGIIVFAYATNF